MQFRSPIDMGVYQYQTEKPNAVTNISNLSGSRFNTQENNIQYTPFNKVSQLELSHINSSSKIAEYNVTYGPDDQRRKTESDYLFGSGDDDEISTIYVNDGLYEERSNGEILHYIVTPAGFSALVVTQKNEPSVKDIYYLYNDHLGSLIAATQRGSTVLEEFSYDPWGRRRNPNDWNDYDVAESSLFTRGFTGHEHIGAYGLINMNGRVYDARLGRFLSPDPYVQAPDYSQSYNRYSYVWNNPLKYTDPSGEFIHLIIGAIIGGYTGYKIGKANGATGWSMFGYIAGGAAVGTLAGHVGASVFASGMAAGTAAGMGGISTGFNAGLLSGMASGAITGGGMAALGGASFSDVLAGVTMGAWMGGVAGGFSGAIGGGMQNMRDDMNFWGTRLSKNISNVLASADNNTYLGANNGWLPRVTVRATNLMIAVAVREGMSQAAGYVFQGALIMTSVMSIGSTAALGGALWRMGARQVGRQLGRQIGSRSSTSLIQLSSKVGRSPAGQRIFSFQTRFPKSNLNIRLDRGFRAPLKGMSKAPYLGKPYNGFNTHVNIQRPGSFNFHLTLNPLKWKYYNLP